MSISVWKEEEAVRKCVFRLAMRNDRLAINLDLCVAEDECVNSSFAAHDQIGEQANEPPLGGCIVKYAH
jgi:hypothetical protein